MKEAIDTEYPVLIVRGVCEVCVCVCVCVIKHNTCHYTLSMKVKFTVTLVRRFRFFRSNLIILNCIFYTTLSYFNYMLQVNHSTILMENTMWL